MDINPEYTKRSFFRTHKFVYLIFCIFFIAIVLYQVMSAPTNNISRANRQPISIHVTQGESLNTIANTLEDKNVIKSHTLLKVFLTVFKLDKQVARGDYLFDKDIPVWKVAWMLARGHHNVDPIKITFKEGITNEEIVSILESKFSAFRRDLFVSDPKYKQGYLFPDTYFFFPMVTSPEIISDMSHNFAKHLATLDDDIAKSGHTEEDIIIMASVLEKETSGKEDISIISGILWKRLKQGMPLQVDAAKETYTNKGLPKNPISNPGIVAINAAINPTDSPYLFYLHDKNGNVHYAKTFSEHKSNINKYLK